MINVQCGVDIKLTIKAADSAILLPQLSAIKVIYVTY